MDLKKIADEYGIGYLMDHEDEFYVGDKIKAVVSKAVMIEREQIQYTLRAHLREPQVIIASTLTDSPRFMAIKECICIVEMRKTMFI